jgi:alpha-beta hydrolase superfamily lysophospholipase
MRVLRWSAAALALLALAFPVRHFSLAVLEEYRNFRPQRLRPTTPSDSAALSLEHVTLTDGQGRRIRGWYLPGRNQGAIVLAHGSGANREQMLPAGRVLQRGGFGVLLFDWPAHGESEGRVEYGKSERTALQAAIDYVAQRPDVQATRIGLYGFSLGGFIALQGAVADSRVGALATMAAPTDLMGHLPFEYESSGLAALWGATLAIRFLGGDADSPQPRETVGRLAPRPLLVMNGALDRVVAPEMARDLVARAGEPKTLWILPDVGHTEVMGSVPANGERLLAFFVASLPPAASIERGLAIAR